jgi:YD repeat-containing protein
MGEAEGTIKMSLRLIAKRFWTSARPSKLSMSVIGALLLLVALPIDAFGGTITYTYDTHGRLASAAYSDGTTICYLYDSAGNRSTYTITTGSCTGGTQSNWGSFTWGAGVW